MAPLDASTMVLRILEISEVRLRWAEMTILADSTTETVIEIGTTEVETATEKGASIETAHRLPEGIDETENEIITTTRTTEAVVLRLVWVSRQEAIQAILILVVHLTWHHFLSQHLHMVEHPAATIVVARLLLCLSHLEVHRSTTLHQVDLTTEATTRQDHLELMTTGEDLQDMDQIEEEKEAETNGTIHTAAQVVETDRPFPGPPFLPPRYHRQADKSSSCRFTSAEYRLRQTKIGRG